MKSTNIIPCTNYLIILILLCAMYSAQADILWQIGKPDNSSDEFALSKGQWNKYQDKFPSDCLYIIGQSKATDWSYILPGPHDSWAGEKSHEFIIVFGLKAPLENAKYQLQVNLVDTHSSAPPVLKVKVNDTVFEQKTPKGGSDRSLTGDKSESKRFTFDLDIPASVLHSGNNIVDIINDSGSWVLFDSISFSGSDNSELRNISPETAILNARVSPGLIKSGNNRLYHPISLDIIHIGEPVEAALSVDGGNKIPCQLKAGAQNLECLVPAVETTKKIVIDIVQGGSTVACNTVEISPVRKWEINLIHQTHLDIGYTDTQDNVLDLQVQHLYDALDYIDKSSDYPYESQFKYHPEGMWAVDEFMRRATPADQARLVDAARKRQIHIDSMYAQAMTGGYSEEELFELMHSAVRFCEKYNIKLDSCIQSDVPGYTWGLVSALAQNGIKYISVGPNGGHRLGYLYDWGDKPFYWLSPDGGSKVLFWMDGSGYAKFHGKPKGHAIKPETIFHYIKSLEQKDYPYDMVMLRYCIERDNGSPNPVLSDCVKKWNEKYAWPRLVIAGNGEFMERFEKRYGDKLPEISGDFTPYWEDGMASTAADTSVNRRACERIVQAQALWTMLKCKSDYHDRFDAAWEKLIMYDEHTWGAWNSISEPDSDFAVSQAEYKSRFAKDGSRLTENIVSDLISGSGQADSDTIYVYNTVSWKRSEIVKLSPKLSSARNLLRDCHGKIVPSQRLNGGELAFIAKDVSGLGACRYTLESGISKLGGNVSVEGNKLENDHVTITIDEMTGAINSLIYKVNGKELVDGSNNTGINDYLYMLGRDDSRGFSRITGPVKITVVDAGPLVGTLQIESSAPGCNKLTRIISIVSGSDKIELTNITDKFRERRPEGVYFEYPFNIPGGKSHIDIPWATCRPEQDQIVGANRNYYCVQRWVDVSNADYGVTWVTLDAPMLQFHPIKIASVAWFDTKDWHRVITPSPRFYSWVMNNHWETNYKADQEGIITFKYVIKPHSGSYNEFESQKTGRSVCQPLIAVSGGNESGSPLLELADNGIVVTSIRPSRDGKAVMVRLFNTSENNNIAEIRWHKKPKHLWFSNTREFEMSKVHKPIKMNKHEIITLRVVL